MAAIVLASAALRALLSLDQSGPVVVPDEFIYNELGRSLADTGDLAIRGFAAHTYPPAYPVLLAPVYAAFDNLESAYRFILALNPLVMSTAAVPAYFLARRVATRGLALVVALLTVAVPSMAYARFVMTENLFYPLFLVVLYVLFLALEKPTPKRQALLIAALLVAGLTRFQAVALVPATVTAIVLLAYLDGSRRGSAVLQRLREYWLIWAAFVLGGLVFLVTQLVRGKGLLAPPSSYGGIKHDFGAAQVARWFVYHLAELDLYVGVIPFVAAALVVVASLRRNAQRHAKILASVTLALTFWVVLLAAAFASESYIRYIEERYVFYLAPLFFVALIAASQCQIPRTQRPTLIVLAAACALLPALVPLTSYTRAAPIGPQALALRPLWRVQQSVGATSVRVILSILGIAAAGFALALLRRRAALPIAVALCFLLASYAYVEKTFHTSAWTGSATKGRTWVDDHVPPTATVAVAWSRKAGLLWPTEFFNRSVGPVYNLGPRFFFGDTPATITDRGLVVDRSGKAASAPYAIADGNLVLTGRKVVENPSVDLALYETNGPLLVLGRAYGLQPRLGSDPNLPFPNLGWSSPTFGFQRYACRGDAVSLELEGNPFLGPRSQRLTLNTGGRSKTVHLRAGERRRMTVPLTRQGPTCAVTFHVSPAVSIDSVAHNGDTRQLGVGLIAFRFLNRAA